MHKTLPFTSAFCSLFTNLPSPSTIKPLTYHNMTDQAASAGPLPFSDEPTNNIRGGSAGRGSRNRRWRSRHYRGRGSRIGNNISQYIEYPEPEAQPGASLPLQQSSPIAAATKPESPVAHHEPADQPAELASMLEVVSLNNNDTKNVAQPNPATPSSTPDRPPPSATSIALPETPPSNTITNFILDQQRRRQAETERQHLTHHLLSGLASLNYRIPHGTTLDSPILVLFKHEINGTTCLEELIRKMAVELEHLIVVIHQRPQFPAKTVNVWKEDQMTDLLTEIVPALAKLIERIGVEVKHTLRTQDGGLRVHVGGKAPRAGYGDAVGYEQEGLGGAFR